jgi:hypothetical protein
MNMNSALDKIIPPEIQNFGCHKGYSMIERKWIHKKSINLSNSLVKRIKNSRVNILLLNNHLFNLLCNQQI